MNHPVQFQRSMTQCITSQVQRVTLILSAMTAKPRSVQLGRSSLVTIPCNCHIQTAEFHTIRALCELHTEVEIHFPANFAMLSAFNFSAILNSPTSSVGKSDIKLQLPSLQSLLDETALSSKHKTTFGHDLKEMVEKLKRAELKQSAILPEISIQNLFNSWDSILTFGISGLWLLLVTIGTVFLWIKVRSVNLALISIIPAAKAFDLKHTTTLPSVEEDCFTVELPVLVQLIVGLAFLALFLWYCGKISRWFWNQKRNCFKVSQRCFLPPQFTDELEIFLRVSNSSDSLVLYLTSIQLESFETKIMSVPTCIQSSVTYGVTPVINFAWSGPLLYSVNNHKLSCALPLKIAVAPRASAKLRLFGQSFEEHLSGYNLLVKSAQFPGFMALPQLLSPQGFDPCKSDRQRQENDIFFQPPSYHVPSAPQI